MHPIRSSGSGAAYAAAFMSKPFEGSEPSTKLRKVTAPTAGEPVAVPRSPRASRALRQPGAAALAPPFGTHFRVDLKSRQPTAPAQAAHPAPGSGPALLPPRFHTHVHADLDAHPSDPRATGGPSLQPDGKPSPVHTASEGLIGTEAEAALRQALRADTLPAAGERGYAGVLAERGAALLALYAQLPQARACDLSGALRPSLPAAGARRQVALDLLCCQLKALYAFMPDRERLAALGAACDPTTLPDRESPALDDALDLRRVQAAALYALMGPLERNAALAYLTPPPWPASGDARQALDLRAALLAGFGNHMSPQESTGLLRQAQDPGTLPLPIDSAYRSCLAWRGVQFRVLCQGLTAQDRRAALQEALRPETLPPPDHSHHARSIDLRFSEMAVLLDEMSPEDRARAVSSSQSPFSKPAVSDPHYINTLVLHDQLLLADAVMGGGSSHETE